MNETKLVEALRAEAARSPIFNAVAHMFAMRKRTRFKLTVRNLQIVMSREGFKYAGKQYAEVLEFLADQGLGTLYKDAKGNVQSLQDITYSIASIGKAALSDAKSMKKQRKVKKFRAIPSEVEAIHKTAFVDKKGPVRKAAPYPAFLTVLIEGKPVNFSGPTNLTADTLADFLGSFKRVVDKDHDL